MHLKNSLWMHFVKIYLNFYVNVFENFIRTVLADFALCDWWRYYKALCDVKFRQIEGNGRQFSHIELSSKQ